MNFNARISASEKDLPVAVVVPEVQPVVVGEPVVVGAAVVLGAAVVVGSAMKSKEKQN